MSSSQLNRMRLWATAVAMGLWMHTATQAHDFRAGSIVIDHPYATPSPAGVANGAAYFRGIDNRGNKADRLVGASTPVAERVELHRMAMDNDVMRMREVSSFEIPAGKVVQLRHGQGLHLMLINLKQPLVVGDRFDLTLKFEKAGRTTVKVWVQQPQAGNVAAEHKH